MMAHIMDHSLFPDTIPVEWGYMPCPFDRLSNVKMRMRDLLLRAEDREWSWGQEDAIQWLIKPILVELGFQESDMHRKVSPIPGSRQCADMLIRNPFGEICIIEAKKVNIDLFKPESSESFYNPIDQGLRYFHASIASRCIVTNGIDWCLFDRSQTPNHDYVAVLFRLDLELSQYEHRFPDFIGFFHAESITTPRERRALLCHRVLDIPHKTGRREASKILIHDATEDVGGRESRYRSMKYQDPFAPF